MNEPLASLPPPIDCSGKRNVKLAFKKLILINIFKLFNYHYLDLNACDMNL